MLNQEDFNLLWSIRLVKRLEKIGISVEIGLNVPWIYLDSVNDKRTRRGITDVDDPYCKNHKPYVIGFMVVVTGRDRSRINVKELFNEIRRLI